MLNDKTTLGTFCKFVKMLNFGILNILSGVF